MGQCLRGKMTEAGLIPAPATTLAEPGAPVDQPTAVAAAPATAIADPELDVTPPEPAAPAPENLIAATFGLLRAEPDGSVVIAGSGTPGTEIEVYANDSLLGKATVETSGDWVLVPDAPIPPGGTEITLGEAGKTGRAGQSFVVAINEDKSSEPLVVASTPGAASEVLQGLASPSLETRIAAADPVVPAPEPTASAATPDAPAVAVEPAIAAEPAAAEEPAAAASGGEPAAPAGAAPAAPVAEEPAATADAAPASPAIVSPAPAATSPATASAAAAMVAAVEPPAANPAAPAIVLDGAPPTIDAIELDGDRTFFAGAGPDGATMRLYVDDVFIADTKVADGRWLVEAGKVLTKPSQRVRVDLLQPDSAKVASRAEVNFVVDLPAEEQPIAVAETAAPEPVALAADPVAASEPAPAAEPSSASAPVTAPSTAPPADTAPVVEPAPVAGADMPPTMVAVSVGDPETQRFASGKAIIRRGDNLWTIARRVYGEGVKYTTIYEANTGQIRDPDRIYPGQVFNLPEGATN